MTDRYDLLTVRESNGKSYFTKLGVMFANKAGDGFNILLDGVPASVDGQYRLIAKLPREDNDRQRSAGNDRQQSRGNGGPQNRYADDSADIPFARNDGIW